MSTAKHEMFRKFKQLSVKQDDDTKVEVREDEEQGIKLQEIIDLLVAAGYFRARIKGLSPFDKVVGGMTWCMESCSVDVDVDLLFQENSTIGQKIALTEKIVSVLPKLKCPHAIEPHQIQGLDFIHIFPVIQWLVKRSMEFRQEQSAFVRLYAINQYHKDFETRTDKAKNVNLLQNINKVNEVYRPRRYYKRKTASPEDVDSRVQITLLEYGLRGSKQTAQNKSDERDVVEDDSEKQFEQLLHSMAEMKDDHFLYEDLAPKDIIRLAKHYEVLQSELQDGGSRSREEQKLSMLQEQLQIVDEHCKKLREDNAKMDKEIEDCATTLKTIEKKRDEADKSLKEMEETAETNPKAIKEVEDMVILNDNLRKQEQLFREHCKQELSHLQALIDDTRKAKTPVLEEIGSTKEIEEANETLKAVRLQLAKKNRAVAVLQRQIDDIPGRAELAQYQRRFLELYNQVAAKHKETKQYYTLYNTLEDQKQYMKREMSLLNSISDSYPEAMETSSGKEEFSAQLESIVDSVRQSKYKVDKRLTEEKNKRELLSQELQSLLDLQRKYVTAVKELSLECKRHVDNGGNL